MTIEQAVDRLAEVRSQMKNLKVEEDVLKDMLLEDGRNEIKGTDFTVKITERTKETFLEEAFIETFSKDENFNKELKDKILESKIVVNQENLMQAVQNNEINIEYVKPFSDIKVNKVVNVK